MRIAKKYEILEKATRKKNKRCKCRTRILVYEKSLLNQTLAQKNFMKCKETLLYFAILKKKNTKIAKIAKKVRN